MSADLTKLVELMKADMEENLLIQRNPWIRNDVMLFDDIFLPVKISHLDNSTLGDYTELFAENTNLSSNVSKRRKLNRKLIWLLGEPGIGKSTLVEKIAYDWAVSEWNMFELVMLVPLKRIHPDDSVDCIFLNEDATPSVFANDLLTFDINDLLEKNGEKCLLIFDGFDEMSSEHRTIMQILKGSKYRNCNVLVTSRPNMVSNIPLPFFTKGLVANVDGFTEDQAKMYTEKMLQQKEKVNAVMKFTQENQSIGLHEMWRYPVLLLFLCILVDDCGFDLNDTSVSLTKLIYKLMKCLYKRYVKKIGKEIYMEQCRELLKKLGRIALKGLRTGKLLFTKGEIEQEAGIDAFQNGIIIGYQDKKVPIDAPAYYRVSFLHSIVHEYLAALYMMQELNESDRRIEDLWPGPWDQETARNVPLLLTFLGDLAMTDKWPKGKGKLMATCEKKFNQETLDLNGRQIGSTGFDFLAEVLGKCGKTDNLIISKARLHDDTYAIPKLVSTMSPSIKTLTFDQCIFVERTASQQLPPRSMNAIHVQFANCPVPPTALNTLITVQNSVHTLAVIIDEIKDSQTEGELRVFYRSIVKLLSCRLASLEHFLIDGGSCVKVTDTIWPVHARVLDEVFQSYENANGPLLFSGNMPDLRTLDISNTNIPKVLMNIIMDCLDGRKNLKKLKISAIMNSRGESHAGLTYKLLSQKSPVLEEFIWNDVSDWMVKRHMSNQDYQSMIESNYIEILTTIEESRYNSEIAENCLPQIKHVDFSLNYSMPPFEIKHFLEAVQGNSTLTEMRLNNMWLPHFMPALQCGFPLLEILIFNFLVGIEMDKSPLPDESHVCTLPKLGSLSFSNLYHKAKVSKNLLRQFFIAIQCSIYMTFLDISGQDAGGNLDYLFGQHGLPELIAFHANDCKLVPRDIEILGSAACRGTLTKLRVLSLKDNVHIRNCGRSLPDRSYVPLLTEVTPHDLWPEQYFRPCAPSRGTPLIPLMSIATNSGQDTHDEYCPPTDQFENPWDESCHAGPELNEVWSKEMSDRYRSFWWEILERDLESCDCSQMTADHVEATMDKAKRYLLSPTKRDVFIFEEIEQFNDHIIYQVPLFKCHNAWG